MTLVSLARFEGAPRLMIVNATLEPSGLLCGLLFVQRRTKSNTYTLRDIDTKKRYRVRLPKSMRRQGVPKAYANEELECLKS